MSLAEEEAEQINSEIEADDSGALYRGMLDILLELFCGEQSAPADAMEIAETCERFLESLHESGQLAHLATVMTRLHELAEGPLGGSPELVRLANSQSASYSSSNKINQLKVILNLRYHGGLAGVNAYMDTLLPQAVPHLLSILPDVAHLAYRRCICDLIAKKGKPFVREVGRLVNSEKPYVVRDAVYILGRIGDTRAVEYLSGAIRYKSREIRLEGVSALSHYRGPSVEQLLLEALLDSDVDIRTAALRTIVSMGSSDVLDSLLAFVESDDFKAKDLTEKRRFFMALAKLGGTLLVPYFGELLARKKFFGRAAENELKLCAIAALALVGGIEAEGVLKEVVTTQSGAVQEKAVEVLELLKRKR